MSEVDKQVGLHRVYVTQHTVGKANVTGTNDLEMRTIGEKTEIVAEEFFKSESDAVRMSSEWAAHVASVRFPRHPVQFDKPEECIGSKIEYTYNFNVYYEHPVTVEVVAKPQEFQYRKITPTLTGVS